MTILCFDLGTKCGYAYQTEPSTKIISGTKDFGTGKLYGGGMTFLNFKRWLNDFKSQIKSEINTVYYEDVKAHKGVYAAHKYGGFKAILTAWCEHHNIPYHGVGVGTIKKHITGKGNASKAEVIKGVIRFGYQPHDDNEADAIALLSYVLTR